MIDEKRVKSSWVEKVWVEDKFIQLGLKGNPPRVYSVMLPSAKTATLWFNKITGADSIGQVAGQFLRKYPYISKSEA
jgi:hypothetical protein